MTEPVAVAVLASGSGSNLQALLDRFNLGEDSSARVELVLGSRPGIFALERARTVGVRTDVLPQPSDPEQRTDEEFLYSSLVEAGIQLVVLAGYLRLVPPSIVRAFHGRMINIHPALLPSFGGQGMYGRRVHETVLAEGCRITGVTVHFVSEEYDRGPIIAQWPVPVMEEDDPETLAGRVLEVEHRLLPLVVHSLATGAAGLSSAGRVEWRSPLYGTDVFENG